MERFDEMGFFLVLGISQKGLLRVKSALSTDSPWRVDRIDKICTYICTKGGAYVAGITYTEARQNLAETMNRVCDHHEPVIITRQKSLSVVLMSLEDYNAIMETAYLLRSPANAARLREALHAADAGKTVQHDLED